MFTLKNMSRFGLVSKGMLTLERFNIGKSIHDCVNRNATITNNGVKICINML